MIALDDNYTAIIAAGDFPAAGSFARKLLQRAAKKICCDHAADIYRDEFGMEPDCVVGDCDSIRGDFRNLIRIEEQETNDLAKALGVCSENGYCNPILFGATGKRDDHTIGNLFRAFDENLTIATDYGYFFPVLNERQFRVLRGSPVSIFAFDKGTRVKSQGLAWPLDEVSFENLYCATLNKSSDTLVKLSTGKKIYVYIPFAENHITLASGSPRRSAILEKHHVDFSVCKTEAEEKSFASDPERTVRENALAKNKACPDANTLSADTIVWCNNKIYGKPRDIAEARQFLAELGGNTHTVFTGVAFNGEVRVEKSFVTFNRMTDAAIDEYIDKVQPLDRAGAYDINQSREIVIKEWQGEYENIMGLPLAPLRDWGIIDDE